MIIKKISVLGLVLALATSIVLQPLVGFAQTATSSNENSNASSSQATSTETTSTSTATSTSNGSSSAPMFILVSSQLVNSLSGKINQGDTASIQAVVESKDATTSNAVVDMSFLDKNNVLQGATTTLSGQNFPANTPVTFQASSSPSLLPGTYHLALSVSSSDRSESFVTFQNVQDFTVLATSTATTSTSTLAISSVAGVSNQDGTGATITWVTNQDANSQVAFGTSTNYTASSSPDSSLVMNHSVNLSGLTPGTLYHFQVMSTNASGTPATSTDQTFTTNTTGGGGGNNGSSTPIVSSSTASSISPTGAMINTSFSNLLPGTSYNFLGFLKDLSGNTLASSSQSFMTATSTATTSTSTLAISSVAGVSNQDGTGATITWVTNQDANSQVAFGTSTNYTASSSPDSSLVMNHSVNLSGLTPGTLYHFQVMSTNASGTPATSTDQTFTTNTTGGGGGTTTLDISSVVATSSASGTAATITWTTNKDADSQVMFGTSTNYTTSTSVDTNLVMNHSVNLSGLTPGTLYHFQVVSKDSSGTPATSSDQTFNTNSGTSTELENRIIDLQTQVVALLQQKVQQLINDINAGILRTQ